MSNVNADLMGRRVRDRHTGFEGVATAYTVFENGCVQWCIEPPQKDGKKLDTHWFDEQRVELIGSPTPASAVASGGGEREHGSLR